MTICCDEEAYKQATEIQRRSIGEGAPALSSFGRTKSHLINVTIFKITPVVSSGEPGLPILTKWSASSNSVRFFIQAIRHEEGTQKPEYR
jgi:hypothetical protein